MLDGKVAQYRFYDKQLTAQEVVQNYRATQGHYSVLSLADISGNAKIGGPAGTNLSGADHSKDKIESLAPSFKPEGQMTSEGILKNGGTTLLDSVNNSNYCRFVGPTLPLTGKWYWEVEYEGNGGGYLHFTGIVPHDFWYTSMTSSMTQFASSYGIYGLVDNGAFYALGSNTLTLTSTNPGGAIIGFAYDADAGALYIYHNGSAQNSGNAVASSLSGQKKIFAQTADPTNALNYNFGSKAFSYSIPSGYTSLASNNLPISTNVDPLNKKKPRDYFDSIAYTGHGGKLRIRGLDFKPDLVWIKNRDDSESHVIFDSVRGENQWIHPDTTGAQTDYSGNYGLLSFEDDGFTLGNGTAVNASNGENCIAWTWKAGGTPTVTNAASAGAAPTSGSVMIDGVASSATLAGTTAAKKISASTKSGFSIVKYVGTGANATIAHGLNKAPSLIIIKPYSRAGDNWSVFAESQGNAAAAFLQQSGGFETTSGWGYGSGTFWNSTSPTASVFSVGSIADMNANGIDHIAYCFANIDGYQHIGTYVGNGNANGPFVYTGFKPAWLLVKESSSNGGYWYIVDNKRNISNTRSLNLYPNAGDAESSYGSFDFLSNGFKPSNTWGDTNANGETYIYMAIAEDSAKYAQGTAQESETEKFIDKEDGTSTLLDPGNHRRTVGYIGLSLIHI